MQIVELGAGELVQSMHDKQVSAILLACTKEERERRYRFSDPLLPLGPVLITPIQAHISSLQELAGKVLAIYQFDDSVLIGQQYPSLILRTYQSMPLVLEGLATGDIDGVLMPAFHAHNLVYPLYASRLSIVTPPLNTYAIYLLTSPDAPAHLIEQVNHSLQQLISNGTYSRLARAFQLYD
jgi:ABC-type amino acid transport substrate-binding protein